MVMYCNETTIDLEQKMNLALKAIAHWVESTGLFLATHKIEVSFLSSAVGTISSLKEKTRLLSMSTTVYRSSYVEL